MDKTKKMLDRYKKAWDDDLFDSLDKETQNIIERYLREMIEDCEYEFRFDDCKCADLGLMKDSIKELLKNKVENKGACKVNINMWHLCQSALVEIIEHNCYVCLWWSYEIDYEYVTIIKESEIKDTFISDDDKMKDFQIMNKSDFMELYSYLTDLEYENTKKVYAAIKK